LSTLKIQLPKAFQPFLQPARYKAAFGGRGSSKSHSFAAMLVADCLAIPGCRLLCVREVQKSLKESVKRLIEDKIRAYGQSSEFDSLVSEIRTPGDGIISFIGMTDHTADSAKSFEGYDRAWIEEAQTLSARSWEILRPTIRKPGSQILATWNPRDADDPIDKFFRGESPPENAIIREINYMDNPWFGGEMEGERAHDEATNPDRYAHVWLGAYEPQAIGAIFNRQNFHRNRIEEIPPDLKRIVVAVDPPISSEAGSDECGIVACGLGPEKPERGYVLKDASMRGTPAQWGSRAIALYDELDADAIVVERNQGGDMVKHTLKTLRSGLKIVEVIATRGKHVRAEPISGLYEENRISHVGKQDKLEGQLANITAGGYEGKGSPDRADALVWGFSELFQKFRGGVRIGAPVLITG
jgi:hypothetical protein